MLNDRQLVVIWQSLAMLITVGIVNANKLHLITLTFKIYFLMKKLNDRYAIQLIIK